MIEFGCQKKEEESTFYIRDNGVGFDMKYADQLFSPFHRLHQGKVGGLAGKGVPAIPII